MMGVELIVDFAYRLKLVGFVDDSIRNLAALVLRLGETVCDVHGGFAVKCGVDAIIYKRISEHDLSPGVASR